MNLRNTPKPDKLSDSYENILFFKQACEQYQNNPTLDNFSEESVILLLEIARQLFELGFDYSLPLEFPEWLDNKKKDLGLLPNIYKKIFDNIHIQNGLIRKLQAHIPVLQQTSDQKKQEGRRQIGVLEKLRLASPNLSHNIDTKISDIQREINNTVQEVNNKISLLQQEITSRINDNALKGHPGALYCFSQENEAQKNRISPSVHHFKQAVLNAEHDSNFGDSLIMELFHPVIYKKYKTSSVECSTRCEELKNELNDVFPSKIFSEEKIKREGEYLHLIELFNGDGFFKNNPTYFTQITKLRLFTYNEKKLDDIVLHSLQVSAKQGWPLANLKLAHLYQDKENFELAISYFNNALEGFNRFKQNLGDNCPSYLTYYRDIHLNLGNCYANLKQIQLALDHFAKCEEAFNQMPVQDAEFGSVLGLNYFFIYNIIINKGNILENTNLYRKVLIKSKDWFNYQLKLNQKNGNENTKTSQDDAASITAKENLIAVAAYEHELNQQYSKAIHCYQSTTLLPNSLLHLAELHSKMGNFGKEVECYQKILAQDQASIEYIEIANLKLGEIYKLGRSKGKAKLKPDAHLAIEHLKKGGTEGLCKLGEWYLHGDQHLAQDIPHAFNLILEAIKHDESDGIGLAYLCKFFILKAANHSVFSADSPIQLPYHLSNISPVECIQLALVCFERIWNFKSGLRAIKDLLSWNNILEPTSETLHLAANITPTTHFAEFIQLMIDMGVNVNLTNVKGETALDCARQCNNSALEAVLIANQSNKNSFHSVDGKHIAQNTLKKKKKRRKNKSEPLEQASLPDTEYSEDSEKQDTAVEVNADEEKISEFIDIKQILSCTFEASRSFKDILVRANEFNKLLNCHSSFNEDHKIEFVNYITALMNAKIRRINTSLALNDKIDFNEEIFTAIKNLYLFIKDLASKLKLQNEIESNYNELCERSDKLFKSQTPKQKLPSVGKATKANLLSERQVKAQSGSSRSNPPQKKADKVNTPNNPPKKISPLSVNSTTTLLQEKLVITDTSTNSHLIGQFTLDAFTQKWFDILENAGVKELMLGGGFCWEIMLTQKGFPNRITHNDIDFSGILPSDTKKLNDMGCKQCRFIPRLYQKKFSDPTNDIDLFGNDPNEEQLGFTIDFLKINGKGHGLDFSKDGNAIEDLINSTLRANGDPHYLIAKEPKNILRYIKYKLQKNFHADDALLNAMKEWVNNPNTDLSDDEYKHFMDFIKREVTLKGSDYADKFIKELFNLGFKIKYPVLYQMAINLKSQREIDLQEARLRSQQSMIDSSIQHLSSVSMYTNKEKQSSKKSDNLIGGTTSVNKECNSYLQKRAYK